MNVCARYPRLESRQLTKFEDDVRDWGLCCGLAFGLAWLTRDDDDTTGSIGDRAYMAARAAFLRWQGGEIEDPEKTRERVIRTVISEFEQATQKAWDARRYDKTEQLMTGGLRGRARRVRDRHGSAGVMATAPSVWDARAELDVGLMIPRYLHDNPPPDGSRFAGDFAQWGEGLRDRGRQRLADLGETHAPCRRARRRSRSTLRLVTPRGEA